MARLLKVVVSALAAASAVSAKCKSKPLSASLRSSSIPASATSASSTSSVGITQSASSSSLSSVSVSSSRSAVPSVTGSSAVPSSTSVASSASSAVSSVGSVVSSMQPSATSSTLSSFISPTLPPSQPTLLLTGISSSARTSPTTCYSPYPTRGYATVELSRIDSSYSGALLVDEETNSINYFAFQDEDGKTIQFDFTNPNQLTISDEEGNYILLGDFGIRFGDSGCALAADIAIHQMLSQLAAPNSPPPSTTRLVRRQLSPRALAERSQIDFVVTAALSDSCGGTYTESLNLSFGPSQCLLRDEPTAEGSAHFTCQWPGAGSNLSKCRSAFGQSLVQLSSLVVALTELTDAGVTAEWLSSVLDEALVEAGVADPIVADAITTVGFLWGAVGLIETINSVVNSGDNDASALTVCGAKHAPDYPMALFVNVLDEYKYLDFLPNRQPPATVGPYIAQITAGAAGRCKCENPGICGEFPTCGASSTCYCGGTVSGGASCFDGEPLCEDLSSCDHDLQCGPTEVCVIGTCCARNVCMEAQTCAVPTMFRRRGSVKGAGLHATGWF